MRVKFAFPVVAALAGVLSLPMGAQESAQSPKPAKSGTATPKVTDRQKHQQKRIRRGVKSGELTKRETLRLEAEQAKIRHDKQEAKADGEVTPAERAKLHHELNKASKDIYKQKHDAQKQPLKKDQ